MTTRRRYTSNPCEWCRHRHRKCDGKRPCSHCIKSKTQCEPSSTSFKFKNGRRRRENLEFSPNQEWVNYKETGQTLSYVHTTQEAGVDDPTESIPNGSSVHVEVSETNHPRSGSVENRRDPGLERHNQRDISTPSSGIPIREIISPVFSGSDQMGLPITETPVNFREETPDRQMQFHLAPYAVESHFPRQRDSYPQGPLKGAPDACSKQAFTSLEEACLIRNFTENLASWFDTCDRDRHFELNVPQRAMFCPVLRYALLTASAGHLTRLAACRGDTNVVTFEGIQLPGLTADTAVRYHDICITYLLELSKDPKEQYNEDVLTAATILRFYEQIDAPSIGIDSEAYLNTIQFIVSTQQNDSFYAYATIQGPPRDQDLHCVPSVSLRHSACLIALRQEIWSAFLNQRTFRLPVCPSNDYTRFDATNDFTWTNRILVWCADLLKFCFGDEKSMPFEQRSERWSTLKQFDLNWIADKPLDFKPLYFEEADISSGRPFPTIWYQNACQAVGAQHIELSRILLAVSNPRLSRLGLAARSANLALEEELRCIIRRLIGLALSNSKCPVMSVDAAVGISLCGEYLSHPTEQSATLDFLADLEFRHAWPTATTSSALKEAWKIRSSS